MNTHTSKKEEPSTQEMADIIKRLAVALRVAAPANDLTNKAFDYLNRHGLANGHQSRPKL